MWPALRHVIVDKNFGDDWTMLSDASYAVPGRAAHVPEHRLRLIQLRQSQDVCAVGARRYRDVQCTK